MGRSDRAHAIELPRDEDGRVVGFQVGKAARIADWMAKREKRETDKLVAVVRATNWNREHPEARAEICARYQAKPEIKAKMQRYQRERRRAEYRADPPIYTCEECGSTWCKAPWIKGPRPRFCGQRCYQRARVRQSGREPGPPKPGRRPPQPKPSARRPVRCGACGGYGHTRQVHGPARGIVPGSVRRG